nr:MAG TPA: hypothetical protein [Caudoviricetes sp.]DAW93664.1 MAG TPA: hypothetical protein [Bacteriophage sp.]
MKKKLKILTLANIMDVGRLGLLFFILLTRKMRKYHQKQEQ